MSTVERVVTTPVQPQLLGFGKRLRQAREQQGLTGAELASKLGLKRSAIGHYETGRTFPSVAVLKKLTRVLGLSMDWLVFDECEEMSQLQDKELAAYFLKADHLSHRERSQIKDFVDGVLARAELEEFKRKPGKGKKRG